MSSTINVIQLTNEGCLIVYDEKHTLNSYSEKVLFIEETTKWNEIQHEARKVEFIGIRTLRNFCGIDSAIFYSPSGKPTLDPALQKEISISHSRHFCALAYGNSELGLDIEEINERILKVQSKFIHEKERSFFREDLATVLTKLWCMKEAMFKLNNRKGIDFKTEMLVESNDGDVYFGKMLCEDGWRKTKMHCFQVDMLIFCLCTYFD